VGDEFTWMKTVNNLLMFLEDGKLKAILVSYKDDYDKLLSESGRKLIQDVARAAVRIEERSGYPQDIEGALFVQEGVWKVAFLQSRDQPLNGMDNKSGITASSSAQDNAASSPAEVRQKQEQSPLTTGGIDFRALPIVTQAVANLGGMLRNSSLQGESLQKVNLTEEWHQIQRMLDAGITPSAERIREDIQASCFKGTLSGDINKVILCISSILRQEETDCRSTDPVLRDMLVVFDSTNSVQQLKAVFIGNTP